MTEEQRKLYFRRIGLAFPDRPVPDGKLLSRLHYRHCVSIPFENLDYILNELHPTDPETQFRQIVLNGRGGFCLDLNMLFGALLKELGYGVEFLGCDNLTAAPGEVYFHAALRVTDCDGLVWWCDVANSDTCTKLPYRFLDGEVQEQPGEKAQFLRKPDGKWLMRTFESGAWSDLYRVESSDITPEYTYERKRDDRIACPRYGLMNVLYCNLPTPFGRRSLNGNIYRESFGESMVRLPVDKDILPWALRQFGLERYAERIIHDVW